MFMKNNIFLVRKVGTSCFRLYSAASKKITTHYTVHPRETDQRWKGIIYLHCYLVEYIYNHMFYVLLYRNTNGTL